MFSPCSPPFLTPCAHEMLGAHHVFKDQGHVRMDAARGGQELPRWPWWRYANRSIEWCRYRYRYVYTYVRVYIYIWYMCVWVIYIYMDYTWIIYIYVDIGTFGSNGMQNIVIPHVLVPWNRMMVMVDPVDTHRRRTAPLWCVSQPILEHPQYLNVGGQCRLQRLAQTASRMMNTSWFVTSYYSIIQTPVVSNLPRRWPCELWSMLKEAC